MKILTLKPIDTFFFKNHQVTESGNDTEMEGLFPPRPNTIYGALRSAYIHEHSRFSDFMEQKDEAVKRWMGTPNEPGDFHIAFCGLKHNGSLLLPVPADYQVVEEYGALVARPLQLRKDSHPSSHPTEWRLFATTHAKSKGISDKYVAAEHWRQAVFNRQPMTELLTPADFLAGEAKAGIALDYRARTAREHYLYRMVKWRFKGEGAFVVYTPSAPDFSSVKFARIGGENRPWTVEQSEEKFPFWTDAELGKLAETIRRTRIAKIILLSPAIWSQGSRPGSYDGKDLKIGGKLKVRLLTAAIGRPSWYGGWDIVYGRPKPRRPMVPAGSVLYIEVAKEQIDDVIALANGFQLTDVGEKEGFGFAVIAGAEKEEE